MRVLLDVSAVPAEPRGAGRYIAELADHLTRVDAPDLDLVLLAGRDDADRWRQRASVPDAPGAPSIGSWAVVDAVPRWRPARLAWEQVVGPRFGRRHDVDLWHGPHYTVPLRRRGASVVTVHDLTMIEHPEWHERSKAAYFGRMLPAAVRHADACICVSRHTARRLEARIGTAADGTRREVVVIPHGVDHTRFRPEHDERSDLDALRSLGVRPPYVAFLGTIEPRKDVPSLIRAFARVATTRPELRLVLAGGAGWDGGAVERAVTASGVAHRVVRTGFVDDAVVPALLRRAGVVVYPSLEEGFGLPALEALACGAPLVTTAGSSVEEFVGDAALLVAPADVEALTAALERALDPAVARVLATRGPAQAAPYTWDAAADAHLCVYRSVLRSERV